MNPILAGILQGVGQAGSALAQDRQRQEEVARQKFRDSLLQRQVGLQEKQYESGFQEMPVESVPTMFRPKEAPLSGTVRVPREVAALYAQLGMKEAEKREAIETGRMIGPHIPQSADTPTMAFTSEEEGAGMSPAIQPADPRAKLTRGMIESGRLPLKDALPFLFPKAEPVTDATVGFRDPMTGTVTPVPGAQSVEPPPVAPGMTRATAWDRRGRPSYTDKPEGRERTMSERYAEAERRFQENPNDPQAREAYERSKQAFVHEKELARARGEGAAGARPISETTATALAAHQNILASIHLLETFTPEEIQTYSGLLNRPMQDVKLALQGMAPGMFGDPDQRFADFKALMGRLQGTAFGEGGKQLTGIELAVVRNYTPTGREAGGAAEIAAKVKNLKLFTVIARDARIQMAKTGREDLDPDMLDRLIRDGMAKAGLVIPGAASSGDPLGIRR